MLSVLEFTLVLHQVALVLLEPVHVSTSHRLVLFFHFSLLKPLNFGSVVIIVDPVLFSLLCKVVHLLLALF